MSGFLADLIEKTLERAGRVLVVFALLVGVAAAVAWNALRITHDNPVPASQTGIAAQQRQLFERQFPNLENMLTLRIVGSDPRTVGATSKDVVEALQTRSDLFHHVLSPGQGAYYETYAFLYQDAARVRQRVEYFGDLRPLLDAVSQSRNLGSISTLTQSVATAAAEGRNPQVFVDVYGAIAKAVEAALNGRSQPVDWTAIAGLAAAPPQRSALILAWPKVGKSDEALKMIAGLLEQKSTGGVRLSVASTPPDEAPTESVELDPKRLAAAAAMAFILIALVLLVVSRHPAYMAVVLIGWAATLALSAVCIALLPDVPQSSVAAIIVAAFFSLALLANATNAIMLSFTVRARSSFDAVDVMGRDAARRLAVPGVFLASLLGVSVYPSSALLHITLTFSILMITTVVVSIVLLPVLWQFVRDYNLDTRFAQSRRGEARLPFVAMAGAIAVAAQFVLLPQTFKNPLPPVTPPPVLSVMASSAEDARSIIAAARSIPEVKGARWLHGFLPDDADEKTATLQTLSVDLPSPAPADELADPAAKRLEEAKQLEAALTTVALAGGVDMPMKNAALAARRSLTAVLETNSATALPQIERDLFSGLDTLASQLDRLAALQAPKPEALDPALRAMFLGPDGIFRIELEPADGVSGNGLAFTLAARGIFPVSRALELQEQRTQFQRVLFVFFGIGTLAAFLLLMLARADHMRALLAGLVTLIAMAVTALIMLFTGSGISQTTLVLALSMLGCLWGQAALSPMSELFRARRKGESRPVDFVHWVLPLSAAVVALSLWLVGETGFAIQALAFTAVFMLTACLQAAVIQTRP